MVNTCCLGVFIFTLLLTPSFMTLLDYLFLNWLPSYVDVSLQCFPAKILLTNESPPNQPFKPWNNKVFNPHIHHRQRVVACPRNKEKGGLVVEHSKKAFPHCRSLVLDSCLCSCALIRGKTPRCWLFDGACGQTDDFRNFLDVIVPCAVSRL